MVDQKGPGRGDRAAKAGKRQSRKTKCILIKNMCCPDNSFMTSVYRKKTFTGLYTKWDSFTPRKYKINLIRTLTYRCFRICSSASLLHSAIHDLRKLLLQNGYPQGIITYNVTDVLNRHKNKPDTPVATVPKKDVIILSPYIYSHGPDRYINYTICHYVYTCKLLLTIYVIK